MLHLVQRAVKRRDAPVAPFRAALVLSIDQESYQASEAELRGLAETEGETVGSKSGVVRIAYGRFKFTANMSIF